MKRIECVKLFLVFIWGILLILNLLLVFSVPIFILHLISFFILLISILIVIYRSGILTYIYLILSTLIILGIVYAIVFQDFTIYLISLFVGLMYGVFHIFTALLMLNELITMENHPERNSHGKHTAIIIVHYSNPLLQFTFLGIKLLICGYWKNEYPNSPKKVFGIYHIEPYKIYSCYNPSEMIPIINNPQTNKIWIFGHGLMHGISFDDVNLYYCEFANSHKKEFIAQMHCCGQGGNSLAHYLLDSPNPENSIVIAKLRNPLLHNPKDIKSYLERIN